MYFILNKNPRAVLMWTRFPVSPQSVGTPLLLHQKQALSWMCARENKCALPPFWEKRGELYYNSLTCFSAKEIPERIRGGILADDMGLVSGTQTYTHVLCVVVNDQETSRFRHTGWCDFSFHEKPCIYHVYHFHTAAIFHCLFVFGGV